jgi:uncharacterized membrane protein
MFFFPVGYLIFALFILFLPVLFALGYFHIITIGFEKLGISPSLVVVLLLIILISSAINIPLGRKKLRYVEESRFFGLWKVPKVETEGIAINVGGAIIPILISLYFLFQGWRAGFDINQILIATALMIVVCKLLAKVVPGKGIVIPAFIPSVFAVVFALFFAPGFMAPCAFVSGTFGVLIGADILNLRKISKYGGFLSIGGAGVFDGIFLIGIISALLAGF